MSALNLRSQYRATVDLPVGSFKNGKELALSRSDEFGTSMSGSMERFWELSFEMLPEDSLACSLHVGSTGC